MIVRTIPWMTIAFTLLAGCSLRSSPKQEVEAMRLDACRGDTRSYFGRVDRRTLTGNLTRRMTSSARRRNGSAAANLPPQRVEQAAREEVRRVLTEWEDDISKGRRGHLCRMEVDGTTDRYVIVRHPNGKTGRWFFTDEDGELQLTDVQ